MEYQERSIVDGCLSSPILVKELRNRGAQKVIAVTLYDPAQHEEYSPSINLPKFLNQSVMLALNNLSQPELASADVVISPDLKGCKPSEASEYINRGYIAAMAKKTEILRLIR